MKQFSLFLLLLMVAFGVTAQSALAQKNKHACCDPSAGTSEGEGAPATFASLADSKDFRNSHELPVTYTLEDRSGKDITYEVAGGKDAKAYFVEAEAETNQYIFIFHEWWGLNDHIRREADRLSAEVGNVHVIALDLYDGEVATDREGAGKLMQANDASRSEQIIKGALAMAGEEAKIATIGWCFGGGWSLQGSLIAGKQNVGCALYYGMPEKDVEKLKTLNGPVIGIFATEDQWINDDVVEEFEINMRAADQSLQTEVYSANHAFANPSSPRYNEEAAQDANAKSLDFLKRAFTAPKETD